MREALVRGLVIPKFSGIYFISFNQQDPNDQFLRRFQGDSFSIKKKSEATSSTNMFRDTMWSEKATGIRGGAWDIGDVSWQGPFRAKVIVNTSATSLEYVLVKKGGNWVVTDTNLLAIV